MFTWLIKILIKPVIKPLKKAVELCDKLTELLNKLVVVIEGLPLDQVFKDELLGNVNTVKESIATVRSVMIKALNIAGETVIVTESNSDSISDTIKHIKSLM